MSGLGMNFFLRYGIVAMSHDNNDCDVSQADGAILYCDVSDDALEVAASAGAAGYTDPFTRGANCSGWFAAAGGQELVRELE
jgi:hypothetical protein